MLILLRKVILNQGRFCPQGTSDKSGDTFGCYNLGQEENAPGIYWAEAGMQQRTAPRRNNYPAPNVTSGRAEKPLIRETLLLLTLLGSV